MPVTEDSGELHVTDNPQDLRYEGRLGGRLVGFIDYRVNRDGRITLLHTEVDPVFEGHGVGSRLVGGALDDLRRRRVSVRVVCPFVRDYLRRHAEYADLVTAT